VEETFLGPISFLDFPVDLAEEFVSHDFLFTTLDPTCFGKGILVGVVCLESAEDAISAYIEIYASD
jgi:hypothetical protein